MAQEEEGDSEVIPSRVKPFHKIGVISWKVAPQKATRKKIQHDSDSDFSLDDFDHDDTFSFSDDEYVDDSLEILKKNSSPNNNAYFAEKDPRCAIEKNSTNESSSTKNTKISQNNDNVAQIPLPKNIILSNVKDLLMGMDLPDYYLKHIPSHKKELNQTHWKTNQRHTLVC